ncbi:pyruvate formate lyase activating enzyme [Lachnospiraceae bacterium XBB1006]|nr:pyruvate formate lyase activating enzyme [Lachnospiraceae bacterium XBB1006]
MSIITSIQKYSIHDGDGIRTTVFFKGCPLSCKWCHNPETQHYHPELLFHKDNCVGCGQCIYACKESAITLVQQKAYLNRDLCKNCGACIDACNYNLRELVGTPYTVEELFSQIKKDEMFYEQSGGGVTLSGGEVMTADMDFLEALCKKLYRYGISIFVDTCGQAPYSNYERLLPYIDTFLYDIKTTDVALHKAYIGTDPSLILSNLEKLSAAGARIYIRIPVIREVNGNREAMADILRFLKEKQIQVAQVNLLPYHKTGSAKYARMGIVYPGENLHAPTAEEMDTFVALFKENGYHKVYIGG